MSKEQAYLDVEEIINYHMEVTIREMICRKTGTKPVNDYENEDVVFEKTAELILLTAPKTALHRSPDITRMYDSSKPRFVPYTIELIHFPEEIEKFARKHFDSLELKKEELNNAGFFNVKVTSDYQEVIKNYVFGGDTLVAEANIKCTVRFLKKKTTNSQRLRNIENLLVEIRDALINGGKSE